MDQSTSEETEQKSGRDSAPLIVLGLTLFVTGLAVPLLALIVLGICLLALIVKHLNGGLPKANRESLSEDQAGRLPGWAPGATLVTVLLLGGALFISPSLVLIIGLPVIAAVIIIRSVAAGGASGDSNQIEDSGEVTPAEAA
jgi:hypothetical protein